MPYSGELKCRPPYLSYQLYLIVLYCFFFLLRSLKKFLAEFFIPPHSKNKADREHVHPALVFTTPGQTGSQDLIYISYLRLNRFKSKPEWGKAPARPPAGQSTASDFEPSLPQSLCQPCISRGSLLPLPGHLQPRNKVLNSLPANPGPWVQTPTPVLIEGQRQGAFRTF